MKYTPGLMVGQLSGKAGNTVASRNRSGSYFRTRTIPKLVRNSLTTAVRAAFSNYAQTYRALEEAQRNGWTALGQSIVRRNSLGTSFHLSGLQAFESINRNLDALGQTPVNDPPFFDSSTGLLTLTPTCAAGASETTTVTTGATSATQTVGDTSNMFAGAVLLFATAGVYRTVVSITDATHVVLDSSVASTTGETITWTGIPTFSLAFTPTTVPADTNVVVYVTAPLSAGISRPPKSAYRQLTTMAPSDSSPADIAAAYAARFGGPNSGSKIFVRLRFISLNGVGGQEIINVCTVS
jgi:hypothetical protein